MEEEKQHQKQLRMKDLYHVLLAKVQAIRLENLPAEKWTNSALKLDDPMAQTTTQCCNAKQKG